MRRLALKTLRFYAKLYYSASRLRAIRGVETRNFASLHLFFEHVYDSNENRYIYQSSSAQSTIKTYEQTNNILL